MINNLFNQVLIRWQQRRKIALLIAIVSSTGFFPGILAAEEGHHNIGHELHEEVEGKGPHGGRLLSKDNLTMEITMFERNMPPHFRVFLYQDNQPVKPTHALLQMTLKRFNREVNHITFVPVEHYLQSVEVINEPHSFDVNVILNLNEKTYSWNYSSYEGRVIINPEVVKAANIKVAKASGAQLEKKLEVIGKIVPNRETSAPIYPRYSGLIKSMTKQLGDNVKKDEPLAVIESNESLQAYTIFSPITGTIVKKQATVGELAKGDTPIYEIANLDTVWSDLMLYRKEFLRVKKGMKVIVVGDEGKPQATSQISYISPLGIEDSQTTLARVILPNVPQLWLPGMYVNASIIVAEKTVAIAVPHSALQRWRDWDVIFVQKGNQFEAAPVEIGEQDDNWVEILSGLKPGDTYVTENSFFLKADLEKSGATHDH